MPRISLEAADAALVRAQPVAEADLAWGAASIGTWDGSFWQVLRRRVDENGQPIDDVDDDGQHWAGLECDQEASAAAAAAWQAENPAPGESPGG